MAGIWPTSLHCTLARRIVSFHSHLAGFYSAHTLVLKSFTGLRKYDTATKTDPLTYTLKTCLERPPWKDHPVGKDHFPTSEELYLPLDSM